MRSCCNLTTIYYKFHIDLVKYRQLDATLIKRSSKFHEEIQIKITNHCSLHNVF